MLEKRMFRPLKPSLLAIAVASLLFILPASAQPSEAVYKVELLNATLLTIMKNAEKLKFTGRYKTLEPVLLDSFDMGFMAQFSAGRHWRSLSKPDRKRLLNAFSKLWISTYADRFDGYGGEKIEIIGTEKAPRDTLMVKTKIVKLNGEKVPIDYLLRQKAGVWLMIDIFLKGRFSELAKQRAEYTSILKRSGISGLVATVDDKVRRMQSRSR
tara:strand:- start:734 stop:1369 length:636 start_codon:yes stop_codon:yes gene_type:complete